MEDSSPSLVTYLINLERSKDRRDVMQRRLADIRLEYQLFPAIDGRQQWDELKDCVEGPAFRRNTGREIIPAEIGTYHSHLGVWKRFIETNEDIALVLEDDVVFHDDFKDALALAISESSKWDFLKLNKIRAKHPQRKGHIGPYKLNAYIGPATGLGAYLIKRDLVLRLLPGMTPITRPIDHELDRIFFHKFRHYGLEPFPSHVDDGNESTITGTGFSRVKKFQTWQRLPNYTLRLYNLIRKFIYLMRT